MDDLVERLTWGVPYLTAAMPGTGGIIRTEIDDFIVDEVPAYEPCGDGEHTYIGIEKRGIATTTVANQLAQKLGLRPRDVSFAGRKDTRAITRQTFCVHNVPRETIEALELDNARVLWVSRHRNKLRMGHLRGNRFTIRIRDVTQNAATRAEPILETLARRGVPNAYGPQRFGSHGDNQIVGYHLLRHDTEALKASGIRHPRRRMFNFYISALQSSLFNQVVATRINAGTLDTVITGDVAKKEDTGGIFTVEILAAAGITLEDFRSVKAQGVRRPMRYNPKDLTWKMDGDDQLIVSFFAPKGSFATMLLRELMKTENVDRSS